MTLPERAWVVLSTSSCNAGPGLGGMADIGVGNDSFAIFNLPSAPRHLVAWAVLWRLQPGYLSGRGELHPCRELPGQRLVCRDSSHRCMLRPGGGNLYRRRDLVAVSGSLGDERYLRSGYVRSAVRSSCLLLPVPR